MYEQFIEPIGKLTSAVAENFRSLVYGELPDLRQNSFSLSVDLPRDLYAHSNVQTEWWYYTGHCKTEEGKAFGFELAFFKRRTDLDRFGVVPLRFIANPMYAAHFAISEFATRKFQYDHIRSFGSFLDLPVRMSETEFNISLGEWSLHGEGAEHILHATFPDGLVFDAALEPQKAPVIHGVSPRNDHETSNHFSFTRMKACGTVSKNGRVDTFDGIGWMDREYGTWEQNNWDWFNIHFDDATELMIYHLRNNDNKRSVYSHGRFVDSDGGSGFLGNDAFDIEMLGEWKSDSTGTTYPHGWRIAVPDLDLNVEVSPLFEHQELDTRGTSMVVYWEGACSVKGTRKGRPVEGRSYAELVGYDRSHENPSIISFFAGNYLSL